jgi:hypothetical protein
VPTSDYLAVMDQYAALCLAETADPYEVAGRAQSALTDHLESGDHAGQIYPVWAAITDRWEIGTWSKGASDYELRRMSVDWLQMRSTSGDVAEWADRWYFDECGHSRGS